MHLSVWRWRRAGAGPRRGDGQTVPTGRQAIAGAVACAALFGASTAAADEPQPERRFELEAGGFLFRPMIEARTRAEYRRNPINDGVVGEHAILSPTMPESTRDPILDQALVWERVRLGLEVERGPVLARVTMQDARQYGFPGGVRLAGQPELPVTAPYEAYLELHTDDADSVGVMFRLGRQAVTIGDGRLVGASDDLAPGRPLDAARLSARIGDFDVQGLAAMLVFPAEDTPAPIAADAPQVGLVPGAQLYVVDATWHAAPFIAAELTGIARIVRAPLVSFLVPSDTFVGAARVFGDYRGLRYSVLGAFEGGRVANPGDVPNATLVAGAVTGRVEWETSVPLRLTFGAQGAYATGDPGEGDTRDAVGVFDPILPDSTEGFGQSGFYALSNLIEGGADVAIHPVPELLSRVGYRFAGLADPGGPWSTAALFPVGDAPANASAVLGHVVVVDLEARPWPAFALAANYGVMVLGDGARAIFVDTRPGLDAAKAPDFLEYLGVDARVDLP